jgi:hypothetical protein
LEKIQHDGEALADWVMTAARVHRQRTGQVMFNQLPHDVATAVRGTPFDPFYKDFGRQEIIQWYDDHIIWNDYDEIIVVFSANTILWERE